MSAQHSKCNNKEKKNKCGMGKFVSEWANQILTDGNFVLMADRVTSISRISLFLQSQIKIHITIVFNQITLFLLFYFLRSFDIGWISFGFRGIHSGVM